MELQMVSGLVIGAIIGAVLILAVQSLHKPKPPKPLSYPDLLAATISELNEELLTAMHKADASASENAFATAQVVTLRTRRDQLKTELEALTEKDS